MPEMTTGPAPRPRRRRVAFALLATALGAVAAALLVEAGGQLYVTAHRAHRRLALEPDPVLGWKLAPSFRFVNTGYGDDWYAREFSVAVATNARGFHDRERPVEKPAGVVRVALLGDSLVEALQVPAEKGAAARLEAKLDARGGARHEVLNFGVSGFGVGQFLLAYEQEARPFQPDAVFVLVAAFHFLRTCDATAETVFPEARGRRLSLRPTFRLEKGALVRIPPADTEEWRRAIREVMARDYGDERT